MGREATIYAINVRWGLIMLKLDSKGPRAASGSEQPDRAASPFGPHSHERHGCDQDTKQRRKVWAVLTRSVQYIPVQMRPGHDDRNAEQDCDPQRVERQQLQHRPTPALQLRQCFAIACPFPLPCAN